MNFRKLLTYLTIGTAAVIPFAGAQNPTILQGSYISNVFGNSNFVKNPNAQTNVANVTNATRSTTTPLVATSEFNLSLDAGQNATWTLRTFDAGMKGQNCEARFSYRGFATATTTAEIVQNSLVVAQLVLTPSTDPRIASINFPCGDLANATTFRIAQTTANMTGTNEIGGIYTGLATNMANVAQAEFVGSLTWPLASQNTSLANTAYGVFGTLGATNPTIIGDVNFSTTAPKITINSLKPGNYRIVVSGMIMCFSATQPDAYCGIRLTDATNIFGSEVGIRGLGAISGNQGAGVPGLTFDFQYTGPTTSKTFQLEGSSGGTANNIRIETSSLNNRLQISVYRFPTSSELVVTPERQNTFAGIKGVASGGTNNVSSAAWAKLTFGSTLTRTPFGKAKVETNNDYSVTVENMPVGSYLITAAGAFTAQASASGNTTECFFGISDTANSGPGIATFQVNSTGDVTSTTPFNPSSGLSGIYTNTSVANRTFFINAYRGAGGGNCFAFSDTNRAVTLTISPLDQPSNSALYVQGPVKASATGAAIPEGYVNEFSTRSISDTSLRQQSSPVLGTFYYPWTSTLTLPAGNWMLCYKAMMEVNQTSSSGNVAYVKMHIQNQTDSTEVMTHASLGQLLQAPYFLEYLWVPFSQCKPIAITSSKTFRMGIGYGNNTGIASVNTVKIRGDLSQTELYAILLN